MINTFADLICVERTMINLELASKKRALETLSELLASTQPNLTTEEVFSCLLKRERLGSTSIGLGVALPHGRQEGLEKATGAFITLAAPVDYQALDEQPVIMLFAMLVPEEVSQEHLDTLNQLAELFTDADYVQKLQNADSNEAAHKLLVGDANAATAAEPSTLIITPTSGL